jgi:maltose alpha-D-glucosyltransferase/alpha-amylase
MRYDASLLNWMRQMILVRREHHVFGRGTMRFVKPENRKIFAFLREGEGETVLCVFNLSQFAQPVELDLSEFDGRTPVEMLGKTRFPAVTPKLYQLALAPWGFYWFRLEERDE